MSREAYISTFWNTAQKVMDQFDWETAYKIQDTFCPYKKPSIQSNKDLVEDIFKMVLKGVERDGWSNEFETTVCTGYYKVEALYTPVSPIPAEGGGWWSLCINFVPLTSEWESDWEDEDIMEDNDHITTIEALKDIIKRQENIIKDMSKNLTNKHVFNVFGEGI